MIKLKKELADGASDFKRLKSLKERFSEVSLRKLDVSACYVLLHIPFVVMVFEV